METATQRENEKRAVQTFCNHSGIDFELMQEMPVCSKVDWRLTNYEGQPVTFIECKCSNYPKRACSPTYFIAQDKLQYFKETIEPDATDRGFASEWMLLVEWADCMGYYIYHPSHQFEVKENGWAKPNYAMERELCIHIPIEYFHIVHNNRPNRVQ